jgi:hypothetical protein
LETSGKQIISTSKVLKFGAGKGCRRTLGLIVWKMNTYYIESRRKGTSYIERKEGRLTGLSHLE